MANFLDDFFCSKGHEIGEQFESSFQRLNNLNHQVHLKLQTLQFNLLHVATSKATGIEGLLVKLLTLSFNYLGDILHFIFKEYISS